MKRAAKYMNNLKMDHWIQGVVGEAMAFLEVNDCSVNLNSTHLLIEGSYFMKLQKTNVYQAHFWILTCEVVVVEFRI